MVTEENSPKISEIPENARLDFILVVDSHGLVLHASESALDVLQFSSEKLLYKKITDLELPDNLVGILHDRHKQVLKEGHSSRFSYPLSYEGNLEWFMWNSSLLKTMGGNLVLMEAKHEGNHTSDFDSDLFHLMRIPLVVIALDSLSDTFKITHINDEYTASYNKSREELIGQGFFDAYKIEEDTQSLHLDLKSGTGSRNITVELSDQKRHLKLNLVNLGKNRYLIHVSDVTIQVETENALRKDRDTLMAVTSSLPTGILICDSKGKITFANKRAITIFGKHKQLIGKKLHDAHLRIFDTRGWPISEKDSIIEFIAHRTAGISTVKYNIENAEGKFQHMAIHGEPIYEEGGSLKSVILVIEDLSKEIEHQKDLEKSLQEKQVLLHEMNHRVKNNLAVIISVIKMQALISPESAQSLEALEGRIYAIGLLHAMLFNIKADSLHGADEYIHQLIAHIQDSYGIKDVDICSHIGFISVDVSRELLNIVGLIVNELVTNSFKYAFKQENKNNIIEISIEIVNKTLEIIVEDNGIGLPASIIAHGELNSVADGRGINLVLLLTSSVHGRIMLENKPSGGAIAKVSLPVKNS